MKINTGFIDFSQEEYNQFIEWINPEFIFSLTEISIKDSGVKTIKRSINKSLKFLEFIKKENVYACI